MAMDAKNVGGAGVLPGRRPLKRQLARSQRAPIIYGIMGFVVLLLILQLWLFTATMNAWLGGDMNVVWPAFGASALCLLLNIGLLSYLRDER